MRKCNRRQEWNVFIERVSICICKSIHHSKDPLGHRRKDESYSWVRKTNIRDLAERQKHVCHIVRQNARETYQYTLERWIDWAWTSSDNSKRSIRVSRNCVLCLGIFTISRGNFIWAWFLRENFASTGFNRFFLAKGRSMRKQECPGGFEKMLTTAGRWSYFLARNSMDPKAQRWGAFLVSQGRQIRQHWLLPAWVSQSIANLSKSHF